MLIFNGEESLDWKICSPLADEISIVIKLLSSFSIPFLHKRSSIQHHLQSCLVQY